MGTNYYFIHKHDKDYKIDTKWVSIRIHRPFKRVFDTKVLHICKMSMGWAALFMKSDYFSTYIEFEQFYSENKKYLKVVDEYNQELSFGDLLELINYRQFKEPRRLHAKVDLNVYTDPYGYEFMEEEFS